MRNGSVMSVCVCVWCVENRCDRGAFGWVYYECVCVCGVQRTGVIGERLAGSIQLSGISPAVTSRSLTNVWRGTRRLTSVWNATDGLLPSTSLRITWKPCWLATSQTTAHGSDLSKTMYTGSFHKVTRTALLFECDSYTAVCVSCSQSRISVGRREFNVSTYCVPKTPSLFFLAVGQHHFYCVLTYRSQQ